MKTRKRLRFELISINSYGNLKCLINGIGYEAKLPAGIIWDEQLSKIKNSGKLIKAIEVHNGGKMERLVQKETKQLELNLKN